MAAPKLDDKGGSGSGGDLPREGMIDVLGRMIATKEAALAPGLEELAALRQLLEREQEELTLERQRAFIALQRQPA